MDNEKAICKLCGEPMPEGEEMFNYHGYSGNCPKPPLPRPAEPEQAASEAMIEKVWEAFHGIPNPSNDDIAEFTLEQIAQRTAELEKRVEELERILKNFYLRSTPYWTMRNENSK